jgi:hypothetical protein
MNVSIISLLMLLDAKLSANERGAFTPNPIAMIL